MKVMHGFYNMDKNRVELTYSDGSVLMIDCEEVENLSCHKMATDRFGLAGIPCADRVCRTGAVWQN